MSPNKVNRQRAVHGANAYAQTENIRRVERLDYQLRGTLLEGIPNDVTLMHIATKLPWRSLKVLATVSHDWRRAFQGRMVDYGARVRSQTTETFLVVMCTVSTHLPRQYVNDFGEIGFGLIKVYKRTLSLFSPSEERWYKLPLFPGCPSGMPVFCQYVILDSSIYLLGGTRSWTRNVRSAEVHVLDLTGHPLEWRRCANMQIPRVLHATGVMDGKIFVFGGSGCPSIEDEIRNEVGCTFIEDEVRNEVYDPKVDSWSWIAPAIPSASVQSVFSIGKQLFVCHGWMSRDRPRDPAQKEPVSDEEAEDHVRDDDDDDDDIYRDTKLVIKVDARVWPGARLISTRDDDAEDDIDGLQEVMGSRLVNVGKGLGQLRRWSPTKFLAHQIKAHEHRGPDSFLGVYDPAKDDWRVFESESLGTGSVDCSRPENILVSVAEEGLAALVWSMSV